MNVPLPPHSTRAAEGLPRRAFTVAEVERMIEVGLIAEDERIELIGGELVPMSPKGNQHELLKGMLNMHWGKLRPEPVLFIPETTLRLSADTSVEPDFVVFPRGVGLHGLSGDSALLIVEIADSSLGYDLHRKPSIYAAFGVRELWVIDAGRLETHVHRDPGPVAVGGSAYGSISRHASGDRIVPAFAPEALALRLADLLPAG